MSIKTFPKAAFAAFFVASASLAQAQTGTVTNHAFAVGKGPGVTGYTSLLCTSAQLAVGQAAADPICRTLTGDVTIDAAGVTAIGTAKVTAGMIAGMTSAQLRTILSDEVGTGAAYFVGGALGTPASGTLTNATGLPVGGIAAIGANTAVVNATSGSASPTAFAMPSCSTATSALTWTTNTGFGCNSISGSGSVIVPPTVRLTLTQGTPATTSDVTGATSVYLEPFGGGYQIQVYDGVSAWSTLNVAASTYGLPATQSQTGTTHTNTTIDGLTDTSQLVIGMQVTGTNVAASTTISAIPTSTSVTVNNATTGSATNTMTFKLPPSTNYDVYVQNNSGVPRMVWSAAWSNDTTPPTRVLQNGILVQSGVTTNRLLGSVRVSSTAGVIVDSTAICRCLSNIYNKVPRTLVLKEASSTWNYSAAAWALVNNSGPDTIGVLFSMADFIDVTINAMWSNSAATGANAWVGVGVDSTSSPSSTLTNCNGSNASGITSTCIAEYLGSPGVGYHTFSFLQFGAGANTQTWYGNLGIADRVQSGITGMVLN